MSDIINNSDQKKIESEAAAWLAQLDGDDMSAQDLAAFQNWMKRSPLHQMEIRQLTELWGNLNSLVDLTEPIADASSAEIKLKRSANRKFTPHFLTVMIVFTVLAFASLGMVYVKNTKTTTQQPILMATSIGQQQTSVLPDGSSIILNTNSKVEIDYSAAMRKIRLLSGEAVFDVVADKKRPFIVYAGNGVIRAVGTVFSVRIENNAVNVAVTKGAVELSNIAIKPAQDKLPINTAAGFIKSGHVGILSDQKTLIVPVSVEKIHADLSWQTGLLTFSGEPLDEVIAEVSRYTTLDISILDPKLHDLRIGGMFPIGDMDALFEALEVGFGIVAERPSTNEVTLSQSTIH